MEEMICGNCKNWEYGICTVKYNCIRCSSDHKCDEEMLSKDISPDGKRVMFFEPKEKK